MGAHPSTDRGTDVERISQLVAGHVESMEAVCALAAALTLRVRRVSAPPEIESALSGVLQELGLSELGAIPGSVNSAALATVLRGRIAEASELVQDPAGAPGWRPTSREVIEGQALNSEALAPLLLTNVIPLLDGLQARLAGPEGTFLEVGVGAGGLVIPFCRRFERLVALGIDVWEPALELARERVAQAGVAGRIELRKQDAAELEDRDRFDLTWFPAESIGDPTLRVALRRVRLGVKPGGWIVISVLRGGPGLLHALARVRVARGGGSTLSPAEAEGILRSDGWEAVQLLSGETSRTLRLVAGRRPRLM